MTRILVSYGDLMPIRLAITVPFALPCIDLFWANAWEDLFSKVLMSVVVLDVSAVALADFCQR